MQQEGAERGEDKRAASHRSSQREEPAPPKQRIPARHATLHSYHECEPSLVPCTVARVLAPARSNDRAGTCCIHLVGSRVRSATAGTACASGAAGLSGLSSANRLVPRWAPRSPAPC